MTWAELDKPVRDHLEQRLTSGQLDVLILHLAGCGTRQIMDMLSLSRTSVRDKLRIGLNALADYQREDAA